MWMINSVFCSDGLLSVSSEWIGVFTKRVSREDWSG